MGVLFLCLVECFSMIVWTPTFLSVLYACVLYFCICTCSAQLSMFHMEKRFRNTLIIIIIINIIIVSFGEGCSCCDYFPVQYFQLKKEYLISVVVQFIDCDCDRVNWKFTFYLQSL